MTRFVGVLLLLILAPPIGVAQEAPEELLSAQTQVYLRWDGVESHRAAFEKTALGKMMQGDTGKFVTNVVTQLQDTLGALLTVEQLLQGISPAKLLKLQGDATQAPKIVGMLTKNGMIIGMELRKLEPPEAQFTLILPNGGDQPAPMFSTLRLIAGLTKLEIKEEKIEGQTVHHMDLEGAHLATWVAGKHLVLVVGTDPPQEAVKRMTAKAPRLTSNPLFTKVQSFNQFETSARAFVDVAALVRIARTRGKDVGQLLDDLGLDGLLTAVLYSGFDGDSERGLIELEMTGPRKGLFQLVNGKPFKLSDLPPLPQDVTTWSMTNFDMGLLYDIALQAAETAFKLIFPEEGVKVREYSKLVDDSLGMNLRKDLLEALDDKVAIYSSPAEGPLGLGQVILFKIKDAGKLQEALNNGLKGMGRALGTDISIKKKKYHDVELREVHVRQQGFFFVPTYVIYQDWLAVSYFPQPIQGFVLRASGKLPVWKPDERTLAALEKMPKEMISLSLSDPRPTVKHLLSLGPLLGAAIKSFFPDIKFDVGAVPNSHEAAHHLFPNVSVVSNQENMIRKESRSSLELPFDLSGIDNYALLALFGFLAGFAF